MLDFHLQRSISDALKVRLTLARNQDCREFILLLLYAFKSALRESLESVWEHFKFPSLVFSD